MDYKNIKAIETYYIKIYYNSNLNKIIKRFTRGKVFQYKNGREIGIEPNGTITDILTACCIQEKDLVWFEDFQGYETMNNVLSHLELKLA